jgi:hypothetical protein
MLGPSVCAVTFLAHPGLHVRAVCLIVNNYGLWPVVSFLIAFLSMLGKVLSVFTITPTLEMYPKARRYLLLAAFLQDGSHPFYCPCWDAYLIGNFLWCSNASYSSPPPPPAVSSTERCVSGDTDRSPSCSCSFTVLLLLVCFFYPLFSPSSSVERWGSQDLCVNWQRYSSWPPGKL